jgi:hypothetical protein
MANESTKENMDPNLQRAMKLDKLFQGASPAGKRKETLSKLAKDVALVSKRDGDGKRERQLPLMVKSDFAVSDNSEEGARIRAYRKELKEHYKQILNSQLNEGRGPKPMVPVKKVKDASPGNENIRKEADRIKSDGQRDLKGNQSKLDKK